MITQILDKLDKVKSNGKNQWMACCPAHADRSPSLAISEPEPDYILMHCFAGCEVSEILNSLQMSLEDLYPDTDQHSFIKSEPQHERYKARQVERNYAENRTKYTTVLFYEQALKSGQKFSQEENEKYLNLYNEVQESGFKL